MVDPDGSWDARYRFIGFRQRASRTPLVPALKAFLDAGEAPVVLTMGSMLGFDAARLASCFRAALAQCGMRGVLIGGWSGMGQGGDSQDSVHILTIPDAEYVRTVFTDWEASVTS